MYLENNEWTNLFGHSSLPLVPPEDLKRICVEGRLQGSRFRSVCWRLLLNCLPPEKSQWIESASKWRAKFDVLKRQYDVDPHRCAKSAFELQHNNPLSLDNKNPWQQYFDDTELKGSIKQDVERTFPELEYFQSQSVREMMIEILFLYARENPHVAYKQGMHEILGPLIFVLFFDHETFEHASKEGGFEILDQESRHLLSFLTDEKFLEHDAYEMFTQIMLIIQPWYYFADEHRQQNSEDHATKKRVPSGDTYQRLLPEPFARVQDTGQSSVLVQKLNWIGDNLVRHSDPQLYHHLEKLEIPPQIYGIRWLRLLFGREFPIQDLLLLWDAIFADGPPFVLVDYIFVAMLIFIRDLLLDCDYTGCLHYLMRYPPVTDVGRLLAVALHLQNPQKYPKPVVSSMQTNFSTITVAGRPHPNIQRQAELSPGKAPPARDASPIAAAVNKTLALSFQKLNKAGAAMVDGLLEPAGAGPSRYEIEVVSAVNPKKSDPAQPSLRLSLQHQRVGSANGQRQQQRRSSAVVPKTTTGPAKSAGVAPQARVITEEEIELLKEQISCLQVRLSDVEQTAHMVADELVTCAGTLSDRLASLKLPAEGGAYGTLDRIRQLCRVLKGAESAHLLGGDCATGGLNTPVEIGNDPIRALEGIGPATAPLQGQCNSEHQRRAPSDRSDAPTSSNGGARQKVIVAHAGVGPRQRLGVENEMKEISRLKSSPSRNE